MADLVFKINGADYSTGDIGEFITSWSIDECGIYHQWTGEFAENIAETSVNSLFIAACMQIAYQRGNPTMTTQAARKAVGESNLNEALTAFNDAAEQEEDARPPARRLSVIEQNGSPENTLASQRSSGTDTTEHSATPANAPQASGSPPWALSVTSGSPTSGS